jgi:hypothetical protein
MVLGFEHRVLSLLVSHSTTWAIPSTKLVFEKINGIDRLLIRSKIKREKSSWKGEWSRRPLFTGLRNSLKNVRGYSQQHHAKSSEESEMHKLLENHKLPNLTEEGVRSWAPVALVYNPSYSGRRGPAQEKDHSSKPARANSSKNRSQKIGLVDWWIGSRWRPWV